MLTDNYRRWKAFAMGADTLSNSPQELPGELVGTSLNAISTPGYTHIVLSEDTALKVLSDSHSSYVYYGSSNELPSAGDSALKAPYSTVLKIISTTVSGSEYKDHSCKLKISSIAENVSANDLSIGELVWLKQLPLTKGASEAAENVLVCMARCAFESPVILAAGQTKVFNLTMTV